MVHLDCHDCSYWRHCSYGVSIVAFAHRQHFLEEEEEEVDATRGITQKLVEQGGGERAKHSWRVVANQQQYDSSAVAHAQDRVEQAFQCAKKIDTLPRYELSLSHSSQEGAVWSGDWRAASHLMAIYSHNWEAHSASRRVSGTRKSARRERAH